MTQLELHDKIQYQDTGKKGTRTGYIIEFNTDRSRARIRWTDDRPRTWIRTRALTKVSIPLPDDPDFYTTKE